MSVSQLRSSLHRRSLALLAVALCTYRKFIAVSLDNVSIRIRCTSFALQMGQLRPSWQARTPNEIVIEDLQGCLGPFHNMA